MTKVCDKSFAVGTCPVSWNVTVHHPQQATRDNEGSTQHIANHKSPTAQAHHRYPIAHHESPESSAGHRQYLSPHEIVLETMASLLHAFNAGGPIPADMLGDAQKSFCLDVMEWEILSKFPTLRLEQGKGYSIYRLLYS